MLPYILFSRLRVSSDVLSSPSPTTTPEQNFTGCKGKPIKTYTDA